MRPGRFVALRDAVISQRIWSGRDSIHFESLPCACRRDSAVIKEEIKSFLANRRISQAVVAQVTGQSELHLHPYRPAVQVNCSHLVESQDPTPSPPYNEDTTSSTQLYPTKIIINGLVAFCVLYNECATLSPCVCM